MYEDKSYTFILKTPPASVLLKKAAGIDKGSRDPSRAMIYNRIWYTFLSTLMVQR